MKQPQYTQHNGTISDIVDDAFNLIEELGSEMREAYDNTPESLKNSGAGEARGQAADDLESISQPEVPATLTAHPVGYAQSKKEKTRSERRDNIILMLDAVIEEVQEVIGKEEERDAKERRQELVDEWSAFVDELENAKADLENVYFPGMRG